MYKKNKAQIERILDNYKRGNATKENVLQSIQNIIGEEIERKNIKDVYEIEDYDDLLINLGKEGDKRSEAPREKEF